MTDLLPVVEPVAPAAPTEPAAPPADLMSALLGQPAIPPTPSELVNQLAVDRPAPPDYTQGVTARDRLLYGPLTKPGAVPAPPPVALDPSDTATMLTGVPDTLDDRNVKVAARLMQLREGADEAKVDDAVRRLASTNLLKGRAGELFTQLKGGDALADEDWAELQPALVAAAEALQPIGNDLQVGNGKVVGAFQRPEGVALQVEYPEPSGVEDLPMSTSGDSGLVLPEFTLDEPSNGLTVFVGATDVTYAAPPTPEMDASLRALFPGPVGKDGVPRWAKVEPLRLKDHSPIDALAVQEPGVVTEHYPDRESYVGTRPGDWIVFDVPADKTWRQPAWAGQVEALRGGVARSQPDVSLTPVRRQDLSDTRVAAQRLDDSAWAVVPPQGDPKATSKMLASLEARGLEPIELDGDQKAWIVFGLTPDQAAELSPKRPVYTHDGVVNEPEDWESLEELPSWMLRTADGNRIAVDPTDDLSAGTVGRTVRPARRMAVQVDPDQAKYIRGLAADLETSGASNVAIYSRDQQIEGFKRAKEFLFDDGVSVRAVRTKAKTVGEPNGVTVHVRSAAGLPEAGPQFDPDRFDLRDVQFQEAGNTVIVEAADDLATAVRSASLLAQVVGYDRVRLMGKNGRIELHRPQ